MARQVILTVCFLWVILPGKAINDTQAVALEQRLFTLPDDTVKANILLELGKYYCSRENDKALLWLQQALALSTGLEYSRGIANSYLWQGRVYYYKDEYPLAEAYFAQARELLIKSGDTAGLAFYYFASGSLKDLNGNYITAISDYQESIRFSLLCGDKSLESAGLNSLGAIYNRLREPDNALLYLREALEIRELLNDPPGIASILTCIGASFEAKKELDSALWYYEQGYRLRLESNDLRPIASSVFSLGTIYQAMKRYDEAILSYRQAISHYDSLDEKAGGCMATLRLAQTLNSSGRHEQAAEKALEALTIALQLNNNALISDCYETLSDLAASRNNFREAYHYTVLHKKISDLLNQQKKEDAIKEMEARFKVQRIRSEVETLELKALSQQRNILYLVISIVALVMFLTLIILLYRSQLLVHRRQKTLFEQNTIIRKQQDVLAEQEKVILQEQLESQSRELAAKAFEMLRVNETLGRIITRLQEMIRHRQDQPALEHEVSQIVREIELHTQHNSWQEFDTIFTQIHNHFYEKLLGKCPELTSAEIKIAALLKLNLSTKEIASITMKSEEGIKSTRYRLRKKLHLSSDDHLVTYLMQL